MLHGIGITVLSWVLPLILGPVVYVGARYLLNVSDKVDDLPPSVKRIGVVAFGTALSAGLGALGVAAPDECRALVNVGADVMSGAAHACAVALGTKIPVQGVVSGLVAMAIHEIKKSNPNA